MAHSADRRLSAGTARPRRRPGRIAAASFAVVTVALGAAGWAIAAPQARSAGTPRAADVIEQVTGDDGVHYVPASAATTPVVADGRLIAAIITDLTTFWSATLPPITGVPFAPLRGGLTAMDSSADSGTAPCVSTPADIVGNAYYCPTDDGIVYDATTLIPVVLHRYGIGGLITTFAHEFGHAAQARVNAARAADGTSGSPGSHAAPESLTTEARADCDAGAFVAWAVTGAAPHLHIDPSLLIGALGPLVDFSDPVTVPASDPTAHGLAIDRVSWFLTGLRGGARPCVDLGGAAVTDFGRLPSAATANDAPRFGSTTAVVAAAEESVVGFAGPGARGSGVAPSLLAAAGPHGQFAQATLVALEVGGARGSGPAAAACFAGSWVKSVFGHAQADRLGGRPADANEALAAVLLQPHVTVDSVVGFLDGFRSGRSACSTGR